MKFQDLPKLGEKLDGGIFAGLTTKPDGTHCAVVKLPGKGYGLNWDAATAWAAERGGELPSLPVSALLVETMKDQLRPARHWTSNEVGAHSARYYDFARGHHDERRKSYECSAVAVRLIPIAA